MKFILLFIFLAFTVRTTAQIKTTLYSDKHFTETLADSLDKKIDSILILGMGTSLERIFFGDLSEHLSKRFTEKQISATYVFLGNNSLHVQKNYNSININAYDALLFFCPADTAQFGPLISPMGIWVGPHGVNIPYSSVKYKQKFNFYLIANGVNFKKKIWSAVLEIDCDPSSKFTAKKLASKLFTRFELSKYTE